MPEMANDFVIQEFCLMRGNNLVVASNTLDAKQGHRASFFHRGQQAYIGSLNAEDLPRGHGGYVTASVTINHVRLRIALPCHEIVYRIVGHNDRIIDHLVE
jgi:hypothetical protein